MNKKVNSNEQNYEVGTFFDEETNSFIIFIPLKFYPHGYTGIIGKAY